MWYWSIALTLQVLVNAVEVYNVVRNGDFEMQNYWTVIPDQAWCHGWCRYSTVWSEPARSGYAFLLANPYDGAISASQTLQWPKDSNYNRCTLRMYVRALNVFDDYFKVYWDGTAYSVDWMQWEKDSESAPSEWVPIELTLYGRSDTLELRIQTTDHGYVSVDNVEADCYRVEIYENFEFQVFVCIIVVVLFGTVASFFYRKSELDFEDCCKCFRRERIEFQPIELVSTADVELEERGAFRDSESEDLDLPAAPIVDAKNITAITQALARSNSSDSTETFIVHESAAKKE